MDLGILIAAGWDLSWWFALAKGIFGLGIVIFVHELGHFLVAKMAGVKCEKFFVGFDPPMKIGPLKLPSALFRRQIGETEYGIGIIPLGGYVKMLGQDDNPANAEREAERSRQEGEGDSNPTLDPRSYPAKSVPWRMAIISAGVVFNLIFGVLFATAAYQMGVKYTPCVVGGTGIGDPAWVAGIEAGDRIVQLGRDGRESEKLRYTQDLRVTMFSLDKGDSIDVQLQSPDGDQRWVTLTPVDRKDQPGPPVIGVYMGFQNKVGYVFEDSAAEKAGLKPDDVIVAASTSEASTSVQTGVDINSFMAMHLDEPLTLAVERKEEGGETQSLEITIPAVESKRVGLQLGMGPITALQNDAVADRAGLQVGDKMTMINGQPIGDPLTLPQRMNEFVGQSIELTVERDGQSKTFSVTPEEPGMLATQLHLNGPAGLLQLGVGYSFDPKIEAIVPGLPAADSQLQVGDEVVSVELIPREPSPEIAQRLEYLQLDKPIEFKKYNNWAFLIGRLQEGPRLDVKLNVRKPSGKTELVTLPVEISDNMFEESRGFGLALLEETRTAESISEAFALGARETWEGMKQVIIVLRKITDNYQNLGGPLTIAAAASSEAAEGLPRLLVFLTLLSANLAVLNFLPIPVLDGGHMVFLAYEGIVGKPVNERVAVGLTMVGFSLLMGLMLFVFGLDINRFLG